MDMTHANELLNDLLPSLTWPARKKADMSGPLKQRSVAHRLQRTPPAPRVAPIGVSAATTSGSSIAATWLLTALRKAQKHHIVSLQSDIAKQ